MNIIVLSALFFILSAVSLLVGVTDIKDLLKEGASSVILISRFPRLISIVVSGACMSICGLIMQQLSRNRFVSPTTAGTTDAAALGIMLSFVILPHGGIYSRVALAFLFTLTATGFFMTMVERIKFKNTIFIPLVGIIFGNILNAVTTFFGLQFNIVQNMASWLQGDFSYIMQGNYELIYLSIPLAVLSYSYASQFTIAGMGESFAANLGVKYRSIFIKGLVIVSVVTSVIVLTAGTIPFLGLIVPNAVSIIFGDNLRKTLPLTAVSGSIFLLACDIAGRLLIFPFEIPVSVMVGIAGGCVFLYLLLGRRIYD